MTNRDLINQLMNYPLDATINIDCRACNHGTLYAGKYSTPKIHVDGNAYKTMTLTFNDGFEKEREKQCDQ